MGAICGDWEFAYDRGQLGYAVVLHWVRMYEVNSMSLSGSCLEEDSNTTYKQTDKAKQLPLEGISTIVNSRASSSR